MRHSQFDKISCQFDMKFNICDMKLYSCDMKFNMCDMKLYSCDTKLELSDMKSGYSDMNVVPFVKKCIM